MVHSCLWIVHEHSRAEALCLSGSIYEDLDWGGGGGGMYISNEGSAEWYIRVSGIVNHLQWIFPFTRSTFRRTQCAGFFWKLLWLTHRRITDTCSHILSKASATHRGPGLNLSSRSWTDIFCCDTPDLPVPSSSMVVTHVCMYVCAWYLKTTPQNSQIMLVGHNSDSLLVITVDLKPFTYMLKIFNT